MSLLVLIIVVIVLIILALYAIEKLPAAMVDATMKGLLQFLAIVIGIIVIAARGGLL